MITVLNRPTIELIPIVIDYDKNVNDKPTVDFHAENLGKYPNTYIDGVQIESDAIRIMKLYNNSVTPSVEMEFTDKTGRIVDENFPIDGSILSLFINANNENLMPIRMDFKIYDFYIIKGNVNNDSLFYRIKAYLNVNELLLINFKAYKGSSFDVLKGISKDVKLGFASNIDKTEDSMTWVNGSDYIINFINQIVSHSYINDDTFLFGYVDFYYNYNYIDIEKALQDDISEQTMVTDRTKVLKDGKEDILPLTLSNHPDKKSTGMYISKYTIDNKTTRTNIEQQYNKFIGVYDMVNKKYNDYMVDTISDTGADDKIILKGNGVDDFLLKEQVQHDWSAKFDVDNVHKNYLYAEYTNFQNLLFLQKLKMIIVLDKPNFNLYRFQKVNVELYNFGKSDQKSQSTGDQRIDDPNKTVDQYENKIINKLSGEWLITSINYTFSNKDGNKQEITLIKRELTSKYIFKNKNNK